jgi:hypothetical protein
MKSIRFKGREYLFSGNALDEKGFIATRTQFENGHPSYAHYYPDNGVLRFGEKIGDREDIEILGDAEAGMKPGALLNMLNWPL